MEFRNLKAQYRKLKSEIDTAVLNVMSDGQYILGGAVQELERKLAEFVGRKYCVTCANGTDALTLLLMAWGVGKGDAVFVPDITFIASAGAAAVLGATPVFVDVNLDTFNMDCESLQATVEKTIKDGKLTPKAIIAVDLFGLAADYNAIATIAQKYNLKVLEDCAQGFGGEYCGKRNGSFGDGATTSFFPAKPLGCYGDGGAIFVDTKEEYDLLWSLRAQGRSINDKYDNYQIGINSRLDTLQAAILLVKLKALEQYEIDEVNRIANEYDKKLARLVKVPKVPSNCKSVYAQYCILLKDRATRDALMRFLKVKSIPTMVYYPKPLHKQGAFSEVAKYSPAMTNSQDMADCILALPMSPYLTKEEQELVCREIETFFAEGRVKNESVS